MDRAKKGDSFIKPSKKRIYVVKKIIPKGDWLVLKEAHPIPSLPLRLPKPYWVPTREESKWRSFLTRVKEHRSIHQPLSSIMLEFL
jgi:hypothetical protein